jgi:hypothetical protein
MDIFMDVKPPLPEGINGYEAPLPSGKQTVSLLKMVIFH